MAERTHISGANIPNSAACGQWETLLADALDGLLRPEDEATFSAHMSGCTVCTALFDEARRGREWLQFLGPEPEAPEGLLDRILAETRPGRQAGQQPALAALAGAGAAVLPGIPAWQRPGVVGSMRRWAEPRLMMTAAMAFFSIALTLNLTGVRLTGIRVAEIRNLDLRPAAVRSYMERRITMASVPIIRYYDHLRFVYEVQSRMRELRGEGEESQPETNPQPAGPGESKKSDKDGGSQIEPSQPPGDPVQATVNSEHDAQEAAMQPETKGQWEQNGPWEAEGQNYAFRQIQFRRLWTTQAVRASEGSRKWIA